MRLARRRDLSAGGLHACVHFGDSRGKVRDALAQPDQAQIHGLQLHQVVECGRHRPVILS